MKEQPDLKLKRLVWTITFLGIACGAAVDILKTVVEILEDRNAIQEDSQQNSSGED